MSDPNATTVEPIKVAADSIEPGDVLCDLGRYHAVTAVNMDPATGNVCLHFLRICNRWFAADQELTILPGPARCAICQLVFDEVLADRPDIPTADGRVHASCLIGNNPVASARLRAAVDASHEVLFDLDDPGRLSWPRPSTEGSTVAEHFDLSALDVGDKVDYAHFEDLRTGEWVIVRVSDGVVLSRRRKLETHQAVLHALGGTRQHVYPGRAKSGTEASA